MLTLRSNIAVSPNVVASRGKIIALVCRFANLYAAPKRNTTSRLLRGGYSCQDSIVSGIRAIFVVRKINVVFVFPNGFLHRSRAVALRSFDL